MFQFDPRWKQLPATRGSIAFLAQSSNQPNLAVPGHQAQAAQAWIVALRTSGDTCSIFVFLWLMRERQAAVYTTPQQHLPLATLDGLIDEAQQFCESMGFIVDTIPFATLPAEEQQAILDRLPPFQKEGARAAAAAPPPTPPEVQLVTPGPAAAAASSAPAVSPDQIAGLGKLLASF